METVIITVHRIVQVRRPCSYEITPLRPSMPPHHPPHADKKPAGIPPVSNPLPVQNILLNNTNSTVNVREGMTSSLVYEPIFCCRLSSMSGVFDFSCHDVFTSDGTQCLKFSLSHQTEMHCESHVEPPTDVV